MATNLKDMFVNCITDSVKSAKAISEPYQKARAYASIALALATAMQVSTSDNLTSSDEAPVTQSTGKDSIKEAAPKATKVKEPEAKNVEKVAPVEQPIDKSSEDDSTTWTPADLEEKADLIARLTEYKESYGDEVMSQCVSMFTEGVYQSLDNIIPANIDGFVTFLDELKNQAQ